MKRLTEVRFIAEQSYNIQMDSLNKNYEVWYSFSRLVYENGEIQKKDDDNKKLLLKTTIFHHAKAFAEIIERERFNINDIKALTIFKIRALNIALENSKELFRLAVENDYIMNVDSVRYKKMLLNEQDYLKEELQTAKNLLSLFRRPQTEAVQ